MPRPRRLEPAGVALHVVQRGNNRAACFFSDIDRHFYLKCLAEYAERRSCAIHAYALMPNHVHLLVTPRHAGGVSQLMQDLGRRYVTSINKVLARTGSLWEGRFKSNPVDSETYVLACHRYIELNPVRAAMVTNPVDYAWSSHRYYALGTPCKFISEHAVYRSLAKTPIDRRANFLALFDTPQSKNEIDSLRQSLSKGWALGSEAFLNRIEIALGCSVRPPRLGRPPKENPRRDLDNESQEEMLF